MKTEEIREALTPEALVEMKERCARATPGPWAIAGGNDDDDYPVPPQQPHFWLYSLHGGETIGYLCIDSGPGLNEPDPAFAAAARTDLPAALALIADLLDVIEEAKFATESHNTALSLRGVITQKDAGVEKFTTPAWRECAKAIRKEPRP